MSDNVGGGFKIKPKVNGNLIPIKDNVLVCNMYFGEQKTKSGLILRDDDGTTRGIYPRWGQIYAKGPENQEPYDVGDWVLVEHGRWTRGIEIENETGSKEVRMVEVSSILAYSDKKPEGVTLGKEYNDGESYTVDPSSFVNA